MVNTNPSGVNLNTGYYVRTTIQDSLVDTTGSPLENVYGSTGYQGGTGIQGLTGLVGLTGVSFFGSTGIQGVTGLASQSGNTGLQGNTGSYGVTGLTSYGVTGSGGTTGLQGNTGVIGNFGVNGLTGNTGIISVSVGPTGATGIRGITGTSTPGISGLNGRTGITVTGIRGITGASLRGVTGLIGSTGAEGLTGVASLELLDLQRQLAGSGSTLLYYLLPSQLDADNQQLDLMATLQTPEDGTPVVINVTFGGITIFTDQLNAAANTLISLEGTIIRTGSTSQQCVIAGMYNTGSSNAVKSATAVDLGVTQILGVNLNTAGDNGTVLSMITTQLR